MTPRNAPPAPPDLASTAYQRLRELIVSGELAPGSRIIETELAERLALSRTPLRSALHRLLQEGWVTGSDTGRQLRLRVAPTTEEDAAQLYEMIGAVEGLAARWVAGAPAAPRADLVRELESINEEMRQAATGTNPDPKRVFDCHSRFHLRLVEAAGAPRLSVLHGALKPQSDRYRLVYGSALVPVAGEAAVEHEAVLRALARAEPEEAERRARANWSNAARRMRGIIAAQGSRGQ